MAMGAAPTPTPAADPEVVRVALQEVIDAWWNDEPEDLREDLREELQASRGLPQELDRHLLLRVRKVLDRTLSFNEKKTLRDLVRTKVLGVTAKDVKEQLSGVYNIPLAEMPKAFVKAPETTSYFASGEIIGQILKNKGQITTIPATESTFDAQFVNALTKK
jgi:hypothetical protein